MTTLESGSGIFLINGLEYKAGSLEMRPFGESGNDVLIVHAEDGYVFSGRKSFDQFTIDGDTPADRDELLAWAAAHFGLCGTPLPQLGTVTGLAGTVASGHSVLTWNAVTNATNYLLKKNGVTIYSGSTRSFDATGLTDGVTYPFSVVPQAPGYQSGAAATTSVTPTAVVVTNNVEWLSVATDPYTGLLTADAFTYTGSAAIGATSATTEVMDVHAHPDNYYLITRRPVANLAKTKYDESGTSNVNTPVPGPQFPHVFDARGYHYIVSDSVTFNPDPSARVTLHT